MPLKPTRLNFVDVVGNVVNQYQEPALRKQLTLQTNFTKEPADVLADPLALNQILDNLISNAIKFSPLGKNVFITVRPTARGGECTVRDEGPGFTPDDRERMFRRYGRLSARPTGGETSTGLGLSIVRKLVQAMNGELTCQSATNQGTTFVVSLPSPH
jgi:two-component system sensor histidine kinase/response regulator